MSAELLRVEGLSKSFRLRRQHLFAHQRLARAVDDVSFAVGEGEILGVVGESGCGKTTLARLILRLLEPSSGRVWLDGTDITSLAESELRSWRQRMQIVFQDHQASLDPRMTIGRSIGFPLEVHGVSKETTQRATVENLLEQVGLDPMFYSRLPHQLSGGQRQRVAIARALAVGPRLIVADEPVASLDLSAQGQILNLFGDLLKKRGISFVFITHDLNVAAYLCDRIMVMYGGKVVELAPAGNIFEHPRHPYTQALISAAVLGGFHDQVEEIVLEGDPPSPADPPPGCKFHPRCFLAGSYCRRAEPELRSVAVGHDAACHVAHGVPVD